MTESKMTIKQILERNDLAAASQAILRDHKALSCLVRLAYDKDTLVGWRAILAVGVAARELAGKDSAFLRETCRKLLWSLTDESGGIGWSAPELLGEIVSADPRQFADIVPLIANVYEAEEDVFHAGVLYALGRVAEKAPELAVGHQKLIIRSLADKDALVRVQGIRLISMLWPHAKKNNSWSLEYCERIFLALEGLKNDDSETWVYGTEGFGSILVKDEAINAINITS